MRPVTRWLEPLITFVFPAKCRSCEKPMGVDQVPYFCDECWNGIGLLSTPWCRICGAPLQFRGGLAPPLGAFTCADCRTNPPPYRKLRAVAFYDTTVREAIHLLKYERKQVLAKHLNQLLCAHLPEDFAVTDYDLLIPIPLHPRRFRGRGFNQSERIAEGIAQTWSLPLHTDILYRIRDTLPQSSLNSPQEREENIAGAFEVRRPDLPRGRRILLIDDIFTTGTTIREATTVLMESAPERVDVLTLARTRSSR